MKRSDRPPDYLIDQIARHVQIAAKMQPATSREANALRLLKLEVKKLLTYKKNKDVYIGLQPESGTIKCLRTGKKRK